MKIKRPKEGELIPAYPSHNAGFRSLGNLDPGRLSTILANLDAGDIAEAMTLFDEMEEKDLHLGAVSQTRKLAVVARDRTVIPASDDDEDKKIADFVKDVFTSIPQKPAAFTRLLSAVTHGFAIAEIVWEISDGMVTIKDLIGRPQNIFTFIDHEEPARLLDFPRLIEQGTGRGAPLPREKFVFHRHQSGDSACVRAGLYRGISWYYLFTSFTIKDWLTFIDIYGIPLRLGRFKPTADDTARDVLKDAVMNLGSDAAAVISDDTSIEFIQSALAGDHSLFREAAEYFNRQKSKRLLGQTLTTEGQDKGSFALGKIHDQVRNDIVAYDAMALDETINCDLIKPLVDFNFGVRKRYPRVVTSLVSAGETDMKLEQVEKLVAMGAKIPARVVAEITGIPITGDLDESLVSRKGAAA
ncbi:hypothetical protein MNBD_NITROSPINAE02-503 [hydrothermal vent metagenome]|uniref:Mu-like prophage FluMu protein gp29 n=1 Tax=hydrothermal vent metagenome TaxID=652676 RepID=A0A3B1CWW8_9ZZZZ